MRLELDSHAGANLLAAGFNVSFCPVRTPRNGVNIAFTFYPTNFQA
jgi:hypothetical protein